MEENPFEQMQLWSWEDASSWHPWIFAPSDIRRKLEARERLKIDINVTIFLAVYVRVIFK